MHSKKIWKKLSLRETVSLSLRGYRIWHEENPKLLLSTAASAVVKALTPYGNIFLLAKLIEEITARRSPHMLLYLTLAVILFNGAFTMLGAMLEHWKNVQWAGIWHDQNKIFMHKLLTMDFATVSHGHTQELRAQIWQNSNSGAWGFYKLLFCFQDMVSAIVSIGFAAVLAAPFFTSQIPVSGGSLVVLNHPIFTISTLMVMTLGMFLGTFFRGKADSYWTKYAEEHKMGNRLFSFWFGTLGSDRSRALDVRMYRQDLLSQRNLEKYNPFRAGSKLAKAASGPMGGYYAISGALSQMFTCIAIIFICLKALGGAYGIGAVSQYIGAITALSDGVALLFSVIDILCTNTSFLRTVFEFLDMPEHREQGNLPVCQKDRENYKIEFRDVSFRYPGQEKFALRNVSFTFYAGQKTAIVGRNGSGKTTFIKLLCRLYDPAEGQILLNDVDIRCYEYRQYLSILAVVFQDFGLLSFELGQNIAAKINYDSERARHILEKVGFGERLHKLPQGLSTVLYRDFDENGVTISGGEAQKIALARALYKEETFLLILDEPTAALDPKAEFEIYNKMNEITEGRTAIFISHRLSSCRFCRNILVFHEGELVQRGSHEELAADRSGQYYELWNAQAQYYRRSESRTVSLSNAVKVRFVKEKTIKG